MIEGTTVKELIEELINWNYGTVYKGYDNEELTETLEEDTRKFIEAILKAHESELATPQSKEGE